MTILHQWPDGKCVNSAWLWAMELMGIVRNPQLMLNATPRNFISDKRACDYFNSIGYNLDYKSVTLIQFKWVLARGLPIIAWFNWYNMESIRKSHFIAEFTDDKVHSHRFIIINECDIENKLLYNKQKRKELWLLLARNSWGENECDKWYFYIRKEDIIRFWIMFKKWRLFNPIQIWKN